MERSAAPAGVLVLVSTHQREAPGSLGQAGGCRLRREVGHLGLHVEFAAYRPDAAPGAHKMCMGYAVASLWFVVVLALAVQGMEIPRTYYIVVSATHFTFEDSPEVRFVGQHCLDVSINIANNCPYTTYTYTARQPLYTPRIRLRILHRLRRRRPRIRTRPARILRGRVDELDPSPCDDRELVLPEQIARRDGLPAAPRGAQVREEAVSPAFS